MCGIAGVLDTRRRLPDPAGTLNAMRACLRHRGPDNAGTLWHDRDAVGLAHARLSVIDLSPAGHQPMESASGRYAIVFNGEVYNAPALATELAAAGARWRGHSDTEVMLAAIEAWGIDAALPRFAGMFAFAVHDRHERRLHLVRDRLGIKPLHYAWVGGAQTGTFAFASELKALLQVPGFRRTIDTDAVAGFFAHACVPGNDCIWTGVRKVAPGHSLRVDLTTGVMTTSCWWNALEIAAANSTQPLTCDETEATDRLETLLQRVVGECLVSDVPIGAFLSGGIDSTTVAAVARAGGAGSLRAFTVGFDDAAFDERAIARATARDLGVQLVELQATTETLLECVPLMAEVFDEPFADSSQLPTYLISRLTREHATVALSGDGGDEVFGGYHRHVFAHNGWPRLRRLPQPVRHATAMAARALSPQAWDTLHATLKPLLPHRLRVGRAGDRVHKWASMLHAATECAAYEQVTAPRAALTDALRLSARGAGWWSDAAATRLPDFLRRMQFMDQTGYLVDDALVKVDRASMASGLEVRVPLLDHRLVEFAWSLPAHMKVRHGRGKWLLRQVLARHLHTQALIAPKAGFGVPLESWLRGPLRSWGGDLLASRRVADDPMLNAPGVARMWDGLMRGESGHVHQMWSILMYVAWAERWRPTS